MAISRSAKQSLARCYAVALFAGIDKELQQEEVYKSLVAFYQAVYAHAIWRQVIACPGSSAQQLDAVIQHLSKKFKLPEYVDQFLHVIAINRRLGLLKEIIDQCRRLLDEAQGRVRGVLQTAFHMQKQDRVQLQKSLTKHYKLDVELEEILDPSLIAGYTLQIGYEEYDASLRGRLTWLKNNIEKVIQ